MGIFRRWMSGEQAPRAATTEVIPERVSVREVTPGYIQDAFRLITEGSWSEAELKGFPLMEELNSQRTYKLGIFNGDKLVGFAGASPLATPDLSPEDSKYPAGQDIWCGYFVVDPKYRDNISVMSRFKELHDRILAYAKTRVRIGPEQKIYACTEKPKMMEVLERLGWESRGKTAVINRFGKNIGETNVLEYVLEPEAEPVRPAADPMVQFLEGVVADSQAHPDTKLWYPFVQELAPSVGAIAEKKGYTGNAAKPVIEALFRATKLAKDVPDAMIIAELEKLGDSYKVKK